MENRLRSGEKLPVIRNSFWTEMAKFFFEVLIGLVFILFLVEIAKGDEVYNFYFQKAAGPATVIQGGTGATSSSGDVARKSEAATEDLVDSATPAQVAKAPVGQPPKSESRWSVGLGYVLLNDFSGHYEGWGARTLYDLSKYVAVDGGISYTTAKERRKYGYYNDYDGGYSGGEWYDEHRSGISALDAHFGLAITPLRIRLFDVDLIEIGLLAGFHTETSDRTDTRNNSDNAPIAKEVTAYIGPRFVLNMGENFKFYAEGREKPGAEHRMASYTTYGMSYSF